MALVGGGELLARDLPMLWLTRPSGWRRAARRKKYRLEKGGAAAPPFPSGYGNKTLEFFGREHYTGTEHYNRPAGRESPGLGGTGIMMGVIFDFNGTLFFDGEQQERAWRLFAREAFGKEISDGEFRECVHGRNNDFTMQHLAGKALSARQGRRIRRGKGDDLPAALPGGPGALPPRAGRGGASGRAPRARDPPDDRDRVPQGQRGFLYRELPPGAVVRR